MYFLSPTRASGFCNKIHVVACEVPEACWIFNIMIVITKTPTAAYLRTFIHYVHTLVSLSPPLYMSLSYNNTHDWTAHAHVWNQRKCALSFDFSSVFSHAHVMFAWTVAHTTYTIIAGVRSRAHVCELKWFESSAFSHAHTHTQC